MPPIIDDTVDLLISRLSKPLSPPDRESFRHACEDALTRLPCLGEGSIYRCVAALQRCFRVPPSSHRAGWDISDDISTRPS